MAANPQYSEGEVIANKYVVESLLGESPAARTFLANGSAGRLAVKFYRPDVSSRLLAAPDFFLKAGVMTEMEHDNLCVCIDVQEEMGLVFVARAYAEGESFEEWARKRRGDANYHSRGLELLWQISQGLAAMHERTRHLDIHPGNVIVGPLVARLCDWDPRALGNMEMTPDTLPVRPEFQGYRAPEAAGRNGFLSYPSTDLFAVAGLLYRLARGEHPSADPSRTLGDIRALDKDLAGFLSKAMHPRPEERFQDAGAFSDALWDLQPAMARLQERQPRSSSAQTPVRPAAQPAPAAPDPFFPDPPAAPAADAGFADLPAGKEPTLFGAAKPAAGNDTFFNFFPPADPVVPAQAQPEPRRDFQEPAPASGKSGGDTLFGAPSFPSPQRPADPGPAPVSRNFESFDARPAANPSTGSSLSDLEAPGTLFGAQQPLFSAPSKPAPRREPAPPPPPKPMAVSLSSLESDPLEMAGGGDAAGFTAYGFKGAGDNRTGIYTPEAKAAVVKRKLMILLGALGVLVLLLGLGGLFLYLRSNAAQKASHIAAGPEPLQSEEASAPEMPPQEPVTAAGSGPEAPQTQAGPSAARPKPAQPDVSPTRPDPAPAARAGAGNHPYSDPPMPIEPPRPGAAASAQAAPAAAKAPKPPVYQGNKHVSPAREAELMGMVQNRTWPHSASACLKAADELNDLGKTAEANVAYSKALVASDVVDRERILAFGGLAVTFRNMGMRDQARDAVRQILAINPRNAFALKLKEKLK